MESESEDLFQYRTLFLGSKIFLFSAEKQG